MSTGQYCDFDNRFKVSKANGIEFAIAPDNSFGLDPNEKLYNDQEHCGKFFKEFCQPIPCNAEITLQHTWCEDNDTPILGIFNSDGTLITEVPGVGIDGNEDTQCSEVNITVNGEFVSNLSSWSNQEWLLFPSNNGFDWLYNSGNGGMAEAAVNGPIIPVTKVLAQTASIEQGKAYTFKIGVDTININNNYQIYGIFFTSGFATAQRFLIATQAPGVAQVPDFIVTADGNYTSYGIQIIGTSSEDLGGYDILGVELIEQTCNTTVSFDKYRYQINLNNDVSLCETCVTLKIYKDSLANLSLITEENNAPGNTIPGYTSIGFYPFLVVGKRYRLTLTGALATVFSPSEEVSISGANGNLDLVGTGSRLQVQFDFVALSTELNILTNADEAITVLLQEVQYNISSFEAISEPICISDAHDCLSKIVYWNDENFDDISFKDGYKNVCYVPMIPGPISYPQEATVYKTSKGVTKKLSASLSKRTPFTTDYLPEYFRQKLALILMHDHIEIDGEAYVSEEELSVEGDPRYTLAKASFEATTKVYDFDNTNCK